MPTVTDKSRRMLALAGRCGNVSGPIVAVPSTCGRLAVFHVTSMGFSWAVIKVSCKSGDLILVSSFSFLIEGLAPRSCEGLALSESLKGIDGVVAKARSAAFLEYGGCDLRDGVRDDVERILSLSEFSPWDPVAL